MRDKRVASRSDLILMDLMIPERSTYRSSCIPRYQPIPRGPAAKEAGVDLSSSRRHLTETHRDRESIPKSREPSLGSTDQLFGCRSPDRSLGVAQRCLKRIRPPHSETTCSANCSDPTIFFSGLSWNAVRRWLTPVSGIPIQRRHLWAELSVVTMRLEVVAYPDLQELRPCDRTPDDRLPSLRTANRAPSTIRRSPSVGSIGSRERISEEAPGTLPSGAEEEETSTLRIGFRVQSNGCLPDCRDGDAASSSDRRAADAPRFRAARPSLF